MIFGILDATADFTPGTLDAIAGQGTHGVEVIVVAALAVIVCALLVFIYRFYTESRKYDAVRDEALRGITAAVTEYTAAAEKIFDKTADSLDRIEDDLGEGIEAIKAKADANREKIAEHETRSVLLNDAARQRNNVVTGSLGFHRARCHHGHHGHKDENSFHND